MRNDRIGEARVDFPDLNQYKNWVYKVLNWSKVNEKQEKQTKGLIQVIGIKCDTICAKLSFIGKENRNKNIKLNVEAFKAWANVNQRHNI